MCNNNATQAAETTTSTRSVEDMLHEIAFVLRMTRKVTGEMKRDRREAMVEKLQRRGTKLDELLALPV
jgi:hypothetical protein